MTREQAMQLRQGDEITHTAWGTQVFRVVRSGVDTSGGEDSVLAAPSPTSRKGTWGAWIKYITLANKYLRLPEGM